MRIRTIRTCAAATASKSPLTRNFLSLGPGEARGILRESLVGARIDMGAAVALIAPDGSGMAGQDQLLQGLRALGVSNRRFGWGWSATQCFFGCATWFCTPFARAWPDL